jgi:hypothetical protein
MNACSSCLLDARWSCPNVDPGRLIPWRLATAATEPRPDQIEIRCEVHAVRGNDSHAQIRLGATRLEPLPPRSRIGRRENEQAEERPLDGQVLY